MQITRLNLELSKKMASSGQFTPRYCYDNIYNNLGKLVSNEYKEMDIKIMFAYVSVVGLENLYTRHACFYHEDEAIDPTIVNVYKGEIGNCDIKYIPFAIISINEYLKLISKEGCTDLINTFKRVEVLKIEDLSKRGIALMG